MEIIWQGQSFFEIKTKSFRGETVNLAVGSFDNALGLKPPKAEAQILLLSDYQQDIPKTKDKPFLINEPGEYEVKGILIKGISSYGRGPVKENEKEKKINIIYKVESEGIKICHLGELSQNDLSEDQLEEIGEVDILMVPVGGGKTIGAKVAAEIVSQIEPRMVLPMNYKIPGLKMDIEGPDKFLKTMGAENIQPQKKLKITLRDLPKEETEIVILEP